MYAIIPNKIMYVLAEVNISCSWHVSAKMEIKENLPQSVNGSSMMPFIAKKWIDGGKTFVHGYTDK
jgi:hypothetical protein